MPVLAPWSAVAALTALLLGQPCPDPLPWWPDHDLDGWGAPGAPRLACERPPRHVDNDADCDDLRPDVVPVAWYLDADRDGWGDAGTAVASCAPVPLHVPRAHDCDDADPRVHPLAPRRAEGRPQLRRGRCAGEARR